MVSTKKHEALFHLIESSKQSVTEKEKQKVSCPAAWDVWLGDRCTSCPYLGAPELAIPHLGWVLCRAIG